MMIGAASGLISCDLHRPQIQLVKLKFEFGGIESKSRRKRNLGFEDVKNGVGFQSEFRRRGSISIRCKAMEQVQSESSSTVVYQGVYGPWTVEPSDVREVSLSLPLPLLIPSFFLKRNSAMSLCPNLNNDRGNHGSGQVTSVSVASLLRFSRLRTGRDSDHLFRVSGFMFNTEVVEEMQL